MTWNSTWPVGNTSVRANRTTGNQNTTYIETTMGNDPVGTNTTSTRDHFWDVGSNEDGRHRFIQSPAFTVGGIPEDPVIGTGMDGVRYLKTTNGRVEGFYRNSQGIYQYIPSFKSGTVSNIENNYIKVDSVPINVYGEIFMYAVIQGTPTQQRLRTVIGFFRSDASTVNAWAVPYNVEADNTFRNGLKFANGPNASGLDILARTEAAQSGLDWNYRITYREL